jgi:hypothetical protein
LYVLHHALSSGMTTPTNNRIATMATSVMRGGPFPTPLINHTGAMHGESAPVRHRGGGASSCFKWTSTTHCTDMA